MRNLVKSLVGSGLLLGALSLGAQQYNPPQYQPRSEYYRSDHQERNIILNRVRSDLDTAQNRATPFSGDRWKIARAKEAVNEFQQQLNSGNYNRQDLDRAIVATQRVADSSHLPYRMQQFLSNDVNRLREMQTRLEGGL